ncbi:MAG: DUF192 domain-containing protein [Bacillota bacterium]|nr:DUF192 domain-containing protein [Bacillota bacterium]
MLLFVLILLINGCSPDLQDAASEEPEDSGISESEAVILNGVEFTLELALTPEQRSTGLMWRESIGESEGMLFVFPDEEPFPTEVSFWMKNCLVPIDVIFINRKGIITAIHEMEPPLPGTPDEELATYPSRGPIQYAIEIRGGMAAELGLRVGNAIELRKDFLLPQAK